jgi:conjugal transfer ATP-binding protein TraC
MRIIPKNTKIKMKFYKDITLPDIILGVFVLGFLALTVSSNLPNRWTIALIILMVSAPLFISSGENRLYVSLVYLFKYLNTKSKFSKKQKNIGAVVSYLEILENAIKNKNDTYTGVIEVEPIEFHMLNEYKQNSLIDGMLSNMLKNCGVMQQFQIIKLEKPLNLDNYTKDEMERINSLITSFENKNLTEEEFRAKVEIVENRINIIDYLNNKQQILKSAYYIAVVDFDIKNLQNLLNLIVNSLKNNQINAKILNKLQLAIFIRYSYDKNFDEKLFESLKDSELLKNATPNNVQFKALSTVQNNLSLSHFVICDYPLKVTNAWAEELFDMQDTKVVIKINPIEKYKALKRIDYAISEIGTQNNSYRASNMLDRQLHIESLQQLLQGLQADNESFFDVSFLITVYDEKGKNTNKKIVRRKLKELGFKFNEMFGRQQDVYFSSQIDAVNITKISRGIHSSSIAAAFPFISNAVMDEKGILLGENKMPVLLNFFARDEIKVNSNMMIIGKSGSGKSFATKTILTNLASENSKIFILDPENEYQKLIASLHGKTLDVSSSKDGRINPFHIITGIDDEMIDKTNSSFFAHLQFLEEFFKLILQGINPDSLELLNKLILEVYKNKKITAKTNLNKLKAKSYPIFDDLCFLIEENLNSEKDEYIKSCLKVLNNYLSKFKSGGRNSSLWNGPTTFTPKENLICFNFQKLLANKNNVIANAQMLLVLKWVENEVIKNRDYNSKFNANRKIIIAIDEAHVFIDEKFPIAFDFMYQLGKRIRKYNGMQIVITQNIKDFTGSPELARKSSAIINVSQYSLIFSLSPNDMSDLCALYEKAGQINEVESENIVNLPRGCCFLITSPQNRTNIRIVASDYVRELFE